jgi:hypothetical protein
LPDILDAFSIYQAIYQGGQTMPGKADIVTYIILGAFALAIIVFAMMNTGYKGPS